MTKRLWVAAGVATLSLSVMGQAEPNILQLSDAAQQQACAALSQQVLGKSKARTLALSKSRSVPVRLTRQDGVEFPQTLDYRLERLNIELRHGKVVRAYCG
jgi:hypothetical protein